MSHYSHFKAVALILLLSFIMCLSGCVLGAPEEPFFEDRTKGWKPQLMLNVVFNIDDLNAESSELLDVVFDPQTGEIKFCADPTTSGVLKEQYGNLLLSINAAELTSSQLEEIQNAAGWEDAPQKVDLTDVVLPLTAQGAYDLSVAMDVRSWNGSSRLASTGGAFRVYWSDTSGAFFVVTNTYIQAFEASTGKLLLMHSYGKIRSNEYPCGKDDSVIE